MAVDVYVGALSRYYSGRWENVAERWAREHQLAYKVVRPGEGLEGAEGADPETIRAAVVDWREVMVEGLGQHLNEPLDWEESAEAPYFTDRPHWDGYAGLLLLAALEENPDVDPPESVPAEWAQHEALLRSRAQDYGETEYLHVLAPELWLPCEFPFSFQFIDLAGHTLYIGSTPRLLEQLRALNERTFKGTEEQRLEWRSKCPKPGAPFADAARFGLAVFMDLAEQSIAHRLPIKLDY